MGRKTRRAEGIVSFRLFSAPVLSRAVDVAAPHDLWKPSIVATISRYSRNRR